MVAKIRSVDKERSVNFSEATKLTEETHLKPLRNLLSSWIFVNIIYSHLGARLTM